MTTVPQAPVARFVTLSAGDVRDYGCPYCGFFSEIAMPLPTAGGALVTCTSLLCSEHFVALAPGLKKSPFGYQHQGKTIYPRVETHPRRDLPSHGLIDAKPREEAEYFRLDGPVSVTMGIGCAWCTALQHRFKGISGWVQCDAAGERIRAMFRGRARVDYRLADQPKVEVVSCGKHGARLQRLHRRILEDGGILTQTMVDATYKEG